MSVAITHIRLSGGRGHEHIVRFKWTSSDNSVGESDKPTMVDFIDNKSGSAFVGSGSSRVKVHTVHPAHGAPYLQTAADGSWTNNLLSLPYF